jgi:hypothetical protein
MASVPNMTKASMIMMTNTDELPFFDPNFRTLFIL